MPEENNIKHITIRNVIFLSLRNLGIQLVSIVGFFLLTILLGTGEIGLFAIVSESIGILGYFSDMGLASALIQKKLNPTKEDLQTTFTIQQIIVILGLIITSVIYYKFADSRNYGFKEFVIYLSLGFSFLASSLKTIPSILLERKLNFKLISGIDIIENLLFYVIAVIFAFIGFGAFSYAIAAVVRSVVGLVVIYFYSPWNIGLNFSLASAKELFKYGIPFQLNTFIAVAKDRLSNIFVAGIIGRESFGLLSWGQKATRFPLGFMDAIMKVAFPTFSRIQNDISLLRISISRSSHFMAFITFPLLAGTSLIAPDIISIIPKYSKWLPALFPLYIFSFSAAIAAITTPLTNVFNATGKILKTTKYMVMWTVLTWVFYPLLSIYWGYRGTSVAALLVGLSSFVVWLDIKQTFQVSIFKNIIKPFISVVIMITGIMLLNQLFLSPFLSLLIKILFGVLLYFSTEYIIDRSMLLWIVNNSKWVVFKK